MLAVQSGDPMTVEALIEAGADVNQRSGVSYWCNIITSSNLNHNRMKTLS